MGADKQGSKGGGRYVGSFLQLFDWNAKSRKKFSNNSDLPERSKQAKKFEGNIPLTQLNLMDEDATIGVSSIRGSSDYSCASSVTEDEAYVSKPPGVVARLMGLDSLPTSNFSEPYSQPFLDSQSLRDSHFTSRNLEFHQTREISHLENVLNRVDCSVSTLVSKPLKMPSRPIEKFQTEVLPPKSTKSIPITHHKLLSPIKNPSFNYSKNAAHIMEAAAKIIEPGPLATSKAKMPLVGSSSAVPFKVRELKERAEAAQRFSVGGSSVVVQSRVRDLKEKIEPTIKQSRLVQSSQRAFECKASMYHLKGQSLNRSWDGPDTTSFMVLPDTGESSDNLRKYGKSVSLAVQAKVNVQRREGLNSSVSKSSGGQRERSGEVKSSHTLQNQLTSQKSMPKKSPTHRASGVLTQNNQKQNCVVDKNKLSSKHKPSLSEGRKIVSVDSSFQQHRTSSKLAGNSKPGTRKMGLESTDDGNEVLYSNTKNFPRKKRIIDKEFNFEQNHTFDSKYTKPSDSKVPKDSTFDWIEESRKKGIDVVSFSFTAPMSRSQPTNTDRIKLSPSASLGFNVIGSDALSILLEQKLREITIGVRSSRGDSVESESTTSSSSILQHFSPTNSDVTYQSNVHDKKNPQGLLIDGPRSQFDGEFYSNDTLVHKFQGVDEMDECSINCAESKQLIHHRNPSPAYILEPYFSTESSSDSNDKFTEEQSNQYSSIQTQEAIDLVSLKKFNSLEAETAEFLDSASSTSIKPWTSKHKITFSRTTDSVGWAKWELEYVKEILCNVEFMFNEFSLGRSSKIINPSLFYQLENRRCGFDNSIGVSQPQRKVLFDCVGECLDIRCKTWAKGMVMMRKKERLAEEIYKDISSWEKMGDSMVDELVDKDMSSQYGNWADFEVESFEIGVEIEGLIFNFLVIDLVVDILRR